ncbi:MAG: iron-sulfur cluster assembly accessory protein [Bacteroidetes bacterium]|nr:iron-sulfur cluster assembly accessory protein [Bacteroidota bacterium]MDA1122157.1 iron-sulfur cluster assembly accessory protein [Bacteroidota bacterium]
MKIDNPVIIKNKALEEIKSIIEGKGIPKDYGLRIGIKGAGCSGLGFLIGFDKKKDADLEYDVSGVNIYIDKKHVMYVVGLVVDFYEGSDARGFTFTNPEALD